jgi:hypothetical protein
MRASIVARNPRDPTNAAPGFIASLIESAVDSLEVDKKACCEHLLHASALLRAQIHPGSAEDRDLRRGRLACWQKDRVIEYIEHNLELELRARESARVVDLSHFSRASRRVWALHIIGI